MEAEPWLYLCEERYGKVISIKTGLQTERISRFLKPCAATFSEAETATFSTSGSDRKWPRKVNLKGWALPQKNWNKWVEESAPEHCILWKQTGICDAILSSCYEIRCNKEIILCLVEFWCPKTNTFVFPWGEATITLEDVMILGGFSVLGESVTKPVTTATGALEKKVAAMKGRKSALSKERAKKATHSHWMNHFMETCGEFEHVGLLSLWLSRYVFPIPAKETISNDTFPIAAHLSGGTQMALAPAVLAGLYKNLSLLKQQAFVSSSSSSSDVDEITVFAPLKLVLLWAYEHFPWLVQKPPNELKPGEPRAARWHKLNFRIDSSVISDVLNSCNCFQWRPYAAEISNWNFSSYYRATKHFPFDSENNSDEELQSYAVCLRMSHLVGVNCKEKYMPHRVAMQFGMDQDLPGEFSELDFVFQSPIFFVPPRSFEPCVSTRYFNWWTNISTRNSHTKQSPSVPSRLNMDENILQSSTEYKAKKVEIIKPKSDHLNDSVYIEIESEDESLEERSPSIEEMKRTESYDSISPKSFVDTDHVRVSGNLKQMAGKDDDSKDFKGVSRSATYNELHLKQIIKKRSLSATAEETLDCREAISKANGDNGDCMIKSTKVIEEESNLRFGKKKLRDWRKRARRKAKRTVPQQPILIV